MGIFTSLQKGIDVLRNNIIVKGDIAARAVVVIALMGLTKTRIARKKMDKRHCVYKRHGVKTHHRVDIRYPSGLSINTSESQTLST